VQHHPRGVRAERQRQAEVCVPRQLAAVQQRAHAEARHVHLVVLALLVDGRQAVALGQPRVEQQLDARLIGRLRRVEQRGHLHDQHHRPAARPARNIRAPQVVFSATGVAGIYERGRAWP